MNITKRIVLLVLAASLMPALAAGFCYALAIAEDDVAVPAPVAAPDAAPVAAAPAANKDLSPEEFPLPRYDPRPLMQALVERNKPTNTTPFTFVAMSDRHGLDVGMFALFARLKPDFALLTGDIVNSGVGKAGLAQYAKLDREGGDFFRSCPTWSAPGNHEVGKGGQHTGDEEACRRFSAYWGQPHDAIFSFTYANATFIGLPFEFVEGEELKKLEQQLASASAEGKHIFVFGHQPYFSGQWRSKNPVRDAVAQLFSKYKVVAVLGGHSHIYYRQKRDGVNYIVNGTGGVNNGRINHDRLQNRLPGDAWFAGIAGGSGGQFNHPDLKEPIVVEDKHTYFATVITVEGPTVTFRLVDTNNKQWDKAILTGAETKEATGTETPQAAPAEAVK